MPSFETGDAVIKSPRGTFQNGYISWAYAAVAVEKARRAVEGGKLDSKTRRECLAALVWPLYYYIFDMVIF